MDSLRKLNALYGDATALLNARLRFALNGVAAAKGVRLRGKIFIRNHGAITIGPRVCFHRGPVSGELSTAPNSSIEIGESTMINYGCIFNASQRIKIGKRCRFGYHVVIMDSHLHELSPLRRHIRPAPGIVEISDDVWIGTRATVLAGVRIGWGSVVAAGAVVTKDVPPLTVVAGVPAQPVRTIQLEPSVRHISHSYILRAKAKKGDIGLQP